MYQLYHGLLTLKTMLFFTLKDISDIGAMQCFMDGEIVVSLQNIPLFRSVPVKAGWKQQSRRVSQVETEISECKSFPQLLTMPQKKHEEREAAVFPQ